MQKEKLISVIIPLYGAEKYIGKCLESIIGQSYKNLEIIVINDGSKDRSSEIAKGYAATDKRVKVYDYENSGVSIARNRGLEFAKGDYISFVDSDDWLHEDYYKILANEIEKHEADIVKCGVIETDLVKEDIFGFKETRVMPANFDLYFTGMLWIIVCNSLYKREIVNNVKFPPRIFYEDNYASGMYLHKAKKVVEIKENLYYYRKNNQGITKGRNKHPLNKPIVVSILKRDLAKVNFFDHRLDWRIAVGVYHFVRDESNIYKVKAMDKKLYDYVYANLDFRRKYYFLYYVYKNNIELLHKA